MKATLGLLLAGNSAGRRYVAVEEITWQRRRPDLRKPATVFGRKGSWSWK
jgi:hypothetical protein